MIIAIKVDRVLLSVALVLSGLFVYFEDVVEDCSPSVRKIFTSHLQGDKTGR